jgi:predicted phosphodiesterase
MPKRVRILSDLHLGHKVSRVDDVAALAPLVDGVDTLVFNGDTWQELSRDFRPRAEHQLGELRQLCAAAGTEPVFLSGNHDPGWPGDGWLELAGGRIVVTHGDTLLHDGSPWKHEILANPDRVEAMWRAHPEAQHDAAARIRVARAIATELRSVKHPRGRSLFRRAWDAVVPPQRAWHMIDAWLRQADEGAAFCGRYFPQAEFLVIGHFHRAGCWRAGGRVVINTGAFMSPGWAGLVDWFPEEGRLVFADIDESDTRAYKVGSVREVWRLEI